jgi:NitT/TauT family transport system substrate-binding protein
LLKFTHKLISSAQFPGYITDVMIVRNADLKADPVKHKKFMTGVYQAAAFSTQILAAS